MLWIITQRRLVRELHKKRWKSDDGFGSWESKYNGVSPESLSTKFYDEFVRYKVLNKKWAQIILWFIKLFHKEYLLDYIPKTEYVLKSCFTEKYIEMDDGFIVLTPKGDKLIKWYYYWKILFNNAYIKAVIICALTVWVTNYITHNIINSVSNAVQYNQNDQTKLPQSSQ